MANNPISPEKKIVTRKGAMAAGEKYYFTGKACKRGHIDMRHVTGGCVPCERERVRKRNNQRYHDDPEYRERVKSQTKARNAIISADPELVEAKNDAARQAYHIRTMDDEWMEAARERWRNYKKQRHASDPEFAEANRERCREWYMAARKNEDWVEKERERGRVKARENPEKYLENSRNRRARKKGADGTHTQKDILSILDRQNYKCTYCDSDLTKGYHIDHILPLALGGSNWPDNLQCLCAPCNLSKGAKHPDDFKREKGLT